MGLQDEVDAIVSSAFTDADGMMGVESVVYDQFGGDRSTINVTVFRNTPSLQNGVMFRELRVFVRRADIANAKTGDRIEIADRYGGNQVSHEIIEIIKEDAGGYTLRLN